MTGKGRPSSAKCGTPSGYVSHYYFGEKPCQECRKAMAEDQARRRAAREAMRSEAPSDG